MLSYLSLCLLPQTLTSSFTQYANEYTVRIEPTLKKIIFNKPRPAILLRINDKLVPDMVLVFFREVKRDIIFRRKQFKEPQRQKILRIRIQANILSVLWKLIVLLQ